MIPHYLLLMDLRVWTRCSTFY